MVEMAGVNIAQVYRVTKEPLGAKANDHERKERAGRPQKLISMA